MDQTSDKVYVVIYTCGIDNFPRVGPAHRTVVGAQKEARDLVNTHFDESEVDEAFTAIDLWTAGPMRGESYSNAMGGDEYIIWLECLVVED